MDFAAGDIAAAMKSAVEARGVFRIALSGGRTPKSLFTRLAGEDFSGLPWDRVEVFWGDERYVPHDHAESNYRMARDFLLERVPILSENIHPIPSDGGDVVADAARYEDTLRKIFSGETFPRFDFALMGIGEDGHTASLFPDGDAAAEENKWVMPACAPGKELRSRITLTIPVFNAARRVVFLITGGAKGAITERLVGSSEPADAFPARRIRPSRGELIYLLDRIANHRT